MKGEKRRGKVKDNYKNIDMDRGYFWRQKVTPWVILALPIIFTIWLRYYPILRAFFISLYKYDPINRPGTFVGLENYINMFQSKFYWDAWANTFIILFLQIGMTFLIPIIQALFLNELGRLQKTFTTLYIIPALIPAVVNVIIWKWIWHPDYGIANSIVALCGVEPQTWLSDPKLVLFCIVFPGVLGGGLNVLLYLAAIQSTSTDVLESAALDGCVGWRKIVYIILPNIKFMIFIQFIMAVIVAMNALDVPYLYASGGPSGASTTQGIYIFNTFNKDYNYGRGSAASIIMLIIVGIVTLMQMHFENAERE